MSLIENNLHDIVNELGRLDKTRQEEWNRVAPDFNAFEIMFPSELSLSRILGDLLNPNGKHSQGRIFLDRFLTSFIPNYPRKKKETVEISLEHYTENGQIDILMNIGESFSVAIENKPYASDQDNQISRYVKYLSDRFGPKNFSMLYVSSNGEEPTERSISTKDRQELGNQFQTISYSDIAIWIDKCLPTLREAGSNRVADILSEISDYIQRAFMKRNPLKEKFMSHLIEDNILDVFEIHKMWEDRERDYERAWRDKVNSLVNNELPKLVFSHLLKMKVVGKNDWEFVQGNFDIQKEHLEGFRIRKKSWKNSSIGVISDRFRVKKGTRNFFPVVISTGKIDRLGYVEEYCRATGSPLSTEPLLKKPPTLWYASFPDPEYQNWGYEQWKEIKEGGKIVLYVAEYLAKLISICEKDIDEIEL